MFKNLEELLRSAELPIDPGKLDGLDFQKAVFARMFRHLDIVGAELSNDMQGEVDFTLEVPRYDPKTKNQIGYEFHLFECKNYNRSLELSVTAKFILVGLRRGRVASLNLVSRTELDPQSRDYVQYFYDTGGDTGGLYSGDNDRKLGGNTIFQHYITKDLVGFDIVEQRPTQDKQTYQHAKRLTWRLMELRPCMGKPIATEASKSFEVLLRTDCLYRLDVKLPIRRQRSPVTLEVTDTAGITRIIKHLVHTGSSEAIEESFLFNLADCDANTSTLQLCVRKNGGVKKIFPLPSAVIEYRADALDQRPELTARFVERFSQSNEWRILLLTGEGGAGKTWLTDQLAVMLLGLHGTDVMQFNIPENGHETIFRQMAAALAMPAGIFGESDLTELRAIVNETMSHLASRATDVDASVGGRFELLELIAHIAVRRGPSVIVLRNCERLKAVDFSDIEWLISAIERRKWGDVRIVLEGRDGQDAPDWNAMRIALLKQYDNVTSYHVPLMTHDELHDSLKARFEAIPYELIESFWLRTAGNILLLQNFLHWLEAENAITRTRNSWKIISPTHFYRDLGVLTSTNHSSLLGGRSDDILIARIARVSFAPLDDFRDALSDPRLVLGLFALAETPDRISLLTTILRLDGVLDRLLAPLRAAGLLHDEAAPHELRFNHEMLKEAAIALGRRCVEQHESILLSALPPGVTIHEPSELELLADIKLFAGDADGAWVHYQRAVDALMRSESFVDICRVTAKQEALYDRAASKTGRRFIDHLRVLEAKAWAEWNCGSLLAARNSYHTIVKRAVSYSEGSINPTLERSVAGHARTRLVGLNLSLSNFSEFVESAVQALREFGDIGDYNSVLNRLVLCCAELSMPELAREFLPLALEHVVRSDGDDEREIDGAAVICADAGRLFVECAPDQALKIFEQELKFSNRARQKVHARMDIELAQYLCGRTFDVELHEALRADAARLGLYGFLPRLDMFRANVALHDGGLEEAAEFLRRARDRISVQYGSSSSLSIVNALLVQALIAENAAAAEARARELAVLVQQSLIWREQVKHPLQERVLPLARSRCDRIRKQNSTPALRLDIAASTSPLPSGPLLVGWYNVRTLIKLHVLPEPLERCEPDLGTASRDAADGIARFAQRSGIRWHGMDLALAYT